MVKVKDINMDKIDMVTVKEDIRRALEEGDGEGDGEAIKAYSIRAIATMMYLEKLNTKKPPQWNKQ